MEEQNPSMEAGMENAPAGAPAGAAANDRQKTTDPTAPLSLVIGIVAVVLLVGIAVSTPMVYAAGIVGLAGMALGVLSRKRIHAQPLVRKGGKVAVAGTLLGGVALLLAVAWIVINGLSTAGQVATTLQ
jgi:hypothetical protein